MLGKVNHVATWNLFTLQFALISLANIYQYDIGRVKVPFYYIILVTLTVNNL